MFGKNSQDYTVLSGSASPTNKAGIANGAEEEHEICIENSSARYQRRQARRHWWHLLLLYIAIILLLSWNVGIVLSRNNHDPSIGLWSPVKNVVQYQKVEFGKYFKDRSPYTQPPSRELDAMWEDLYNFGLSGLSKHEANKLYDPTVHLPHDNSKYIVTLGVFHQLHCVNHLRKALYPDEYPGLWQYHENGTVNHGTTIALHWDHCLDIIRQALMCQADITPMPFWYRASDDNVYASLETTHWCRNFDDIKSWAKSRQITEWATNGTQKE